MRRWPIGLAAIEAWPTLAVGAGFVLPFLLLLMVSVSHHDTQGLWHPAFELSNFVALFDRQILASLLYTAGLAILVALVSVLLAFPLTYLMTRMRRRAQILWLVLLLSTLSLSEVLIAFAWQVMLAQRIGLSQIFVWLGLLDEPQSLSPSFGAVVAGLVYLVLPICVILLYPALSRLDRELGEAARMLGAKPWQVMRTVTLPLVSGPILSAFILAAVFTIGTYVTPMVLGHPQEWTFAVLIGEAALSSANLPAAAAMSLLLLSTTLLLTGVTILVGRRQQRLG